MRKTILKLIAPLLIIGTSFSQGFPSLQKIVAVDRDLQDRYGWSVDISGDYAIVGAYADDFGVSNPNMGSAYIYSKDEEGIWNLEQKIFNSDQDDYDRFGWSVAIHGNLAVIGAYAEDEDENDLNPLAKAGSVYVFERSMDGVWMQVQKIVASDRTEGDEFGFSVAIHNDLIIVGAHYCNTNEIGGSYSYHAGAAYIFEQNVSGDWIQLQKLAASDRFGNPGFIFEEEDWNWRYGESVAVYEDYVVVGSPYASKGYVYERSGDSWSEADKIEYPGIYGLDRAGIVSIDQTTIVLGAQTWDYSETWGEDELMNAGGAAIFDRDGSGNWNFTQMIVGSDRSAGDHFGISVSIEGNYIISGAHQDNHDALGDADLSNAGSAYIFKKIEGEWTFYDKIVQNDRSAEDEFGIAVGISGYTAIVGAFQQDFGIEAGPAISDGGATYFYADGDDPDCPTVYHSQDISICEGDFVVVGESTYSSSGTYSNTLTSIAGCDSIVTTYLNVITDEPYAYEATICPGETIVIGESTYTSPGIYTDVFSTEAGCDSIVETTILLGDAPSDNDVFIEEGFGFFSTSIEAASFQWIRCDPYELIVGENFPFYAPSEDGYYAVIAYSENGCADTSNCLLWGEEPIDDSGVEESQLASLVSIYPNPSAGQISIDLSIYDEPVQIEVLNELGQVVYISQLTAVLTTIELSDLAKGMYWIKLSTSSEVFTTKLFFAAN